MSTRYTWRCLKAEFTDAWDGAIIGNQWTGGTANYGDG